MALGIDIHTVHSMRIFILFSLFSHFVFWLSLSQPYTDKHVQRHSCANSNCLIFNLNNNNNNSKTESLRLVQHFRLNCTISPFRCTRFQLGWRHWNDNSKLLRYCQNYFIYIRSSAHGYATKAREFVSERDTSPLP